MSRPPPLFSVYLCFGSDTGCFLGLKVAVDASTSQVYVVEPLSVGGVAVEKGDVVTEVDSTSLAVSANPLVTLRACVKEVFLRGDKSVRLTIRRAYDSGECSNGVLLEVDENAIPRQKPSEEQKVEPASKSKRERPAVLKLCSKLKAHNESLRASLDQSREELQTLRAELEERKAAAAAAPPSEVELPKRGTKWRAISSVLRRILRWTTILLLVLICIGFMIPEDQPEHLKPPPRLILSLPPPMVVAHDGDDARQGSPPAAFRRSFSKEQGAPPQKEVRCTNVPWKAPPNHVVFNSWVQVRKSSQSAGEKPSQQDPRKEDPYYRVVANHWVRTPRRLALPNPYEL